MGKKDKGKRQEREEVERSERMEADEEVLSFPGLLAFDQGSRKYIL